MKRVLFVTRDESYPGGSEEFIKNLLLFLSKKKHSFKFYLLEIEGHGKFENINVYKQLHEAGVELLDIPFNQEDIASIDKISELRRIIKDYKIDIVHSFLFNADFLVCAVKLGSQKMWQELSGTKSFSDLLNIIPSIAKLENINLSAVKFVWFSSKLIDVSIALEKNTNEWIKRKDIIDNELEQIVSSHTDYVLPVYKKGLKKWRKMSKNVALLPCTSITEDELGEINKNYLERERIRKRMGILPTERAFITVARLVPEKGIDKLLRLFKPLNDTQNVIYIAGSGFLEAQLKTQSKNYRNIHFLGYLNRVKILDLLVAGDIFILLSDSEGFPLVIQEAMAAGKPILATNVGGTSDLVSISNGRLCDVNSNKSIDKVFQWYLKQSDTVLTTMGNNSKNKLKKYFMAEKIANKLNSLYLKS